jgi:hypothetical protein
MLLWDALLQTGYDMEVLEYRGQLYMEHGLPLCEVHVDFPSHPVFPNGSPWLTWVIKNDMDDTLREGCPRGTHRHVLTAPTGHSRHAHRALLDSGPL